MSDETYRQELEDLEAKGLRRHLRVTGFGEIRNLSSNDYLGLSRHPDVIQAAKDAADRFGTGGTSSRLLAGTFDLHRELEESFAGFMGKEKALVFSSGYHANTGVLPAITGPEDIVFFDRLCHASLIDGIRFSSAKFFSFDHNSADHLESVLRKRRGKYRRAFIVSEGIFSMDGDEGILQEIVYLAEKWNAQVVLDEAHSLGVVGPQGKGLAAAQELLPKVDIWVGTLSKALGSQGGVVAGSSDLIDLLVSRSRSFIYTTALAPPAAGAALKSLSLLTGLDEERELIFKEASRVRSSLQEAGFKTGQSRRQIIPVMTGSVEKTKGLSDYLFQSGFFVPSIRPPTVPQGECRVRLSITKEAADSGLEGLIQVFKDFGAARLEEKPIDSTQ